MTSGPLKKHQHTAPKVYLRGFIDEKSEVTVRRRTGDEADLRITNVTVRSGFYNAKNSHGVVHDTVENWFMNEIESPAGPVLERLRAIADPGPVAANDVPIASSFVAAQLYRTATVRSYLSQLDAHLGPLLAASEVAHRFGLDRQRMSPNLWAQLMRPAGQILQEHQDQHALRASQLRTMLREIDKMIVRLRAWHWHVVEARHPRLITGDAPAVAIQPHPGGFAGVLPQGSPVYLPLSPTRLLIGTEVPASGRVELTTRLARVVNQRIADEADDAIIKATAQSWPRGFKLRSSPPELPAPQVRISPSNGSPTFPATYPDVFAPSIRNVLRALEAENVVE